MKNHVSGKFGVQAESTLQSNGLSVQSGVLKNHYEIECIGADGKLKWKDTVDNIFVDTGLNDMLNKYLKGSAYTAAFYVGLMGATPVVAAGDTLISHGGWSEVTNFLNSPDRKPTLVLGTVAAKSVSNSASKASFAINATVTVGGVFLTTNNARVHGSPITGTLIAAGAFTGGNRLLQNGDVLNVTVTITADNA